MAYYRGDGMRGDYYRGDYYRGDPFLGAIAKWGAKRLGITKVLGKAAKWAGKQIVGTGAKARRLAAQAGPILRDAVPSTIAGTLGYAAGQQGGRRSDGLIQREDGLWERPDGSVGLAPWEMGRSYRKMNPLNPKALRRALRRAQGFEKFARKTVNALYKTVDGRRVKTFKKRGR